MHRTAPSKTVAMHEFLCGAVVQGSTAGNAIHVAESSLVMHRISHPILVATLAQQESVSTGETHNGLDSTTYAFGRVLKASRHLKHNALGQGKQCRRIGNQCNDCCCTATGAVPHQNSISKCSWHMKLTSLILCS